MTQQTEQPVIWADWLTVEQGMVGSVMGEPALACEPFGSDGGASWVFYSTGVGEHVSRARAVSLFTPNPTHLGTLVMIAEQCRPLWAEARAAIAGDFTSATADVAGNIAARMSRFYDAMHWHNADPAERLAVLIIACNRWVALRESRAAAVAGGGVA